MADVVAEMDRLGIGGGVLSKAPRDITPPFVHGTKTGEAVLRETCERLAGFQREYPGRFVTSVGIDPRLGYEASRHVRIAVREYGIKCIRIIPMFTGIAIDDKLAYPLYTAACDEGAVVSINVGVPGPMKPAKLQRTILVDEVALAFPELAIVMSHLGRSVDLRDHRDADQASQRVRHDGGLGAEVRPRRRRALRRAAESAKADVGLGLSDSADGPNHDRGSRAAADR